MSSDLINLRSTINKIITEGKGDAKYEGDMNIMIAVYLSDRIFNDDSHEEALAGMQDGRFGEVFFKDFTSRVTPYANSSPEELKPLFQEYKAKLDPNHVEFLAIGRKTKHDEPKTLEEWMTMVRELYSENTPARQRAEQSFRMLQYAMKNNRASEEEVYRTELRKQGAPV